MARPNPRSLLRLLHISPHDMLRRLDPRFAGTGTVVRGAERDRGVQGVHYFLPGKGRIEVPFTRPSLTHYEVEVPEASIYDLTRDPFGLVKLLPNEKKFRRSIMEAGFQGYRPGQNWVDDTEGAWREPAVLYTPQPVKRVVRRGK